MRVLIRGLARPMLKLIGQDDRGAIGVLVAILIGSGVLLGLGAMVVDVGQIYSERAQLQNGADAGALAVAKSCASGTCTPSVATQYADANSATGTAAANLVCGSGGSLGACPPSTGAITDCPPAPAGVDYVDVHTSTLMPDGSTLLPPVFGRAIVGNQNYNGTTVYACAQAEWGPPSAASGLAVTMSSCEWNQATNDGTELAQPPPYPPNTAPSPSIDRVLELNNMSNPGCPNMGGAVDEFAWTDDPGNDCQTGVISGTYDDAGTDGIPSACESVFEAAQANHTVVFLPVYVCDPSATGEGTTYTLEGFAAFVITGYHFSGFSASDWLDPSNNCTGSDECINGYFTQALSTTPGPIGGTDLGADVVQLTG